MTENDELKKGNIEGSSGKVPDEVKDNDGYAASEKYFENVACPYYPCHKFPDTEGPIHMNCLFCFCPLYHMENCPGNPTYKEKNGKIIKVCTNCTFPHIRDNYEIVMDTMRRAD